MRVRRDLREYLAGCDEWPSRERLKREAAELALRREHRLSGVRRGWTPAAIEAEVRLLVGEGAMWPSRRQFERAGLRSMLIAIYRYEGPVYWARMMNVPRRPGFGKLRSPEWTRDRMRSELERFCAGREAFPTEREFVDAGQRPLYSAARRSGGIGWWQSSLGCLAGSPLGDAGRLDRRVCVGCDKW